MPDTGMLQQFLIPSPDGFVPGFSRDSAKPNL